MWTTTPMKSNALELIKHYGFTYQTTMTYWVKTKSGRPAVLPRVYSKTNVEELLIATKGETKKFLRNTS